MFQKAVIIGCPGAGKSTFARILSDKTHLPLYYLDMLWHKLDRTTVDRKIHKLLDRYKSEKSIYIFHSRADIDDYLLKMFG